jgi:multiple sugar transport system permease protein
MMRILPLAIFLFITFAPFRSEAQERITLRLVDWADLDEMPVDQQAIEAFRKLHPEIDVVYEPNPGHQYEEKILTGLAAGDPPDVFLLDSKVIPTFTNKSVLLDLQPFIRSQSIDTSQWFPEALRLARRGSRLFAFPKGFTPLMIFYNKKLFRDARIPYPAPDWTWDDYLSIAKKLTGPGNAPGSPGVYGTAFTNYYFYWIPWVWSAGGDVLDPGGRRATGFLNSEATENALRFCIDLRTTARVAPDAGSWVQAEKTGTNYALFANGRIGMVIDGHWRMPKFVKYLREGVLDIGVAPLPQNRSGKKVNVIYESGWCVPVNTRHPREAVELAAFMAGETACRIRSAGRLEIPANIRVANEAIARDSTGFEKMFAAEIPYCRQPWGSLIERFSEIEWTLQDAVDEVMLNRSEMHETMTRYAGRIDEELRTIREHESLSFRPIAEHSEILAFLFSVAGAVLLASGALYLTAKRSQRFITGRALSFIAPSLLHLTVFVATPIVFAGYLSFHRWDLVVPDKPYVGAGNFQEILGDRSFWNAVGNTAIFSCNVPLGMIIALAVALLLQRNTRGIGMMRTLFFLPSVTSFVAIALVWMWIYHPSFGAANYLLNLIGLPPLDWLNSTQTAMLAVMMFSVWMGVGYQMVVFLAGLQGIPHELYEAARVDGATGWQRFRCITLPLLTPTTFFILVTSLIGSFQVFTTVYVMTGGGPVRSTDVVVYHIYQAAWEQLRMGYASAMSWVLFLMIMIATWIQFRLAGREVEW